MGPGPWRWHSAVWRDRHPRAVRFSGHSAPGWQWHRHPSGTRWHRCDHFADGHSHICGQTISGFISGALLPSLGFAKTAYTWNLWPRDGSQLGNPAISDFAPNNSNVAVSVVPEPSTLALIALGLGTLCFRARCQRKSINSASTCQRRAAADIQSAALEASAQSMAYAKASINCPTGSVVGLTLISMS